MKIYSLLIAPLMLLGWLYPTSHDMDRGKMPQGAGTRIPSTHIILCKGGHGGHHGGGHHRHGGGGHWGHHGHCGGGCWDPYYPYPYPYPGPWGLRGGLHIII